MNVPQELRYTASHEWVKSEADGTVTVGITDHAQHELTDVVFVEPPKPGMQVRAGDQIAVVESVKAASDIYAPVSGEVVAINDDLEGEPALINTDPFGRGWIFKIKGGNAAELDALAQDRRDLADQVVPGVVAERVVDALEAVDVDDHHRPLAAVAGGEGDVLVELAAEAAPVEQPGERVVVGEVAQLGLGLLGVGQRLLDDPPVLGAQLLEHGGDRGVALDR